MKYWASLIFAALCTGSAVGQTNSDRRDVQCYGAYASYALQCQRQVDQTGQADPTCAAARRVGGAALLGTAPAQACSEEVRTWLLVETAVLAVAVEKSTAQRIQADLDIILRAKKEDEK